MSLTKSMNQAENKARQRDAKNNEVLSSEEIEQASEMQQKAAARGMKLVPERKVKSRVKFAQQIQENWAYLFEIDYLTNAERVFLTDIGPHIGFLSNAIVEDIKSKVQVPCTQKSLGLKIRRSESQMSNMVKKLIEKGILARSKTGGEDSHNSISYALFVNPNIIFCGDRDSVNETLKIMFSRTPKELNKLPVKLF